MRVQERIAQLPKLTLKDGNPYSDQKHLKKLRDELNEERKQRFLLEKQVRKLKEEIEDLKELNEDLKEELATEQVLRLAKESKPNSVYISEAVTLNAPMRQTSN